MRKSFLIVFLVLTCLWVSAQTSPTVDVYYFHITKRCNTCLTIEDLVNKTIQGNHAEALKNGSLKLHVLNCELPENKAISEKYLAYGSTLAITRTIGGKESSEDITGWAFQKAGAPEIFMSELSTKITEALKP